MVAMHPLCTPLGFRFIVESQTLLCPLCPPIQLTKPTQRLIEYVLRCVGVCLLDVGMRWRGQNAGGGTLWCIIMLTCA